MTSLVEHLKELPVQFQYFEAGQRKKLCTTESNRTSGWPGNWPYLGINFFEQNETHIWDHGWEFSSEFVYPKKLTFPLHLRPLNGLLLSAPYDTPRMLRIKYELLYCKNWHYSHKNEDYFIFKKQYKCFCKRFGDAIGSIARMNLPGKGVIETLHHGGRAIHSVLVDEPTRDNVIWTAFIN